MESIRISIIQTDIVWENKQENLRLLHEKLQSLRGITPEQPLQYSNNGLPNFS